MADRIDTIQTALRDLMTAYEACNGCDHPAFQQAERALADSQQPTDCHQPDLVTAQAGQVRGKPLVFDWRKAGNATNPSAWRCEGNWGFAYVLIPYDIGNDPAAGTGTWNANPNHNGRVGFASREEAMAYCEDTIREQAKRAVRKAMADLNKWADVAALPAIITVQEAAAVLGIAALIEAAQSLNVQSAHVSAGAMVKGMDITEAAQSLAPHVFALNAAMRAISGFDV